MTLPQKDNDKDTERLIVRYLRDHPEFFESHLDLLADMLLPHDSGRAVSLIERQVSVLREQKDQHKNRLKQLIQAAEQNESVSQKVNALVLKLLDARDLGEILDLLPTSLKSDFNTDAVVLRLFKTDHPDIKSHPEVSQWDQPVMSAFEKVIANRRPICGRFKAEQLQPLFHDSATTIHSAALIPLVSNADDTACIGILAIGSKDPERFHAEMGTIFLAYLGQVITRVMRLHLTE
ncbi:MAG: DUF484 family protein [Gammaproteobacteria bacterium]